MNYRELSKILGVSPATISLIVNNKPGVSEKTRQEVIQKLKNQGYLNLIPKSKEILEPDNIAFVVFKRDGKILDQHPFFLLLMQDLVNVSYENGFNILISHLDTRLEISHQLEAINALNVKGLLVFATEMENDDLKYFSNINLPIVFLDNHFSMCCVNTVSIDNSMGTFQSIEHIKKLGHKHIAHIRSVDRISSFNEREEWYTKAINYFGFDQVDRIDARYSEEGSYHDILEYIIKIPKDKLPTALVADDDMIITGALRAVTEYGLSVPEDISLIGFSNRPVCEITTPQLSTVSVDRYGLTAEAIETLVQNIRSDEKTQYYCKKRISTSLLDRESTAHPRAGR